MRAAGGIEIIPECLSGRSGCRQHGKFRRRFEVDLDRPLRRRLLFGAERFAEFAI